MDGVFEFFLKHLFAGVARQLQQEEASVGLGQEVVGRVVLVQDLNHKLIKTLVYSSITVK